MTPTHLAASESEALEPSPDSRRRFLILVGGLGALLALLAWVLEPALYVHLQGLDPCARVATLRLLTGVLGGTLVAGGLLLTGWVIAIHRARQFPRSNRWLLRRTRVARGRSLLLLKAGLGLCALLTLVIGSAALVLALHPRLLPEPAVCAELARPLANGAATST